MTLTPTEEAPVIVQNLADELEAPDTEGTVPEVSKPEGEEKPPETPPVVAPVVDSSKEMDELRQIIRGQRMQMAALQDQVGKIKTPAVSAPRTPSDDLDDVFGERKPAEAAPQDPPQPTHFEALQQELSYLGATKGPILDTLIEVMALKPGYEDIKDVCSQSRFSHLVDTAAQAYAQDKNVDLAIATLEIEAAIWRKANPYEWMYKMIKEVHPDFRQPTAPAAPAAAPEPKKPVEAPTSVVPLGGNALEPGSTWTAAKIDAMEEDAYAKLPQDIKDKYLAGELDAK